MFDDFLAYYTRGFEISKKYKTKNVYTSSVIEMIKHYGILLLCSTSSLIQSMYIKEDKISMVSGNTLGVLQDAELFFALVKHTNQSFRVAILCKNYFSGMSYLETFLKNVLYFKYPSDFSVARKNSRTYELLSKRGKGMVKFTVHSYGFLQTMRGATFDAIIVDETWFKQEHDRILHDESMNKPRKTLKYTKIHKRRKKAKKRKREPNIFEPRKKRKIDLVLKK